MAKNQYTAKSVGDFWGQVLKGKEIIYDGLDMSEAVQMADTLNGNNDVSRKHYNY